MVVVIVVNVVVVIAALICSKFPSMQIIDPALTLEIYEEKFNELQGNANKSFIAKNL